MLVPYEKPMSRALKTCRARVPDISKIGRLTGWSPTLGLAQILDDVIASFRG